MTTPIIAGTRLEERRGKSHATPLTRRSSMLWLFVTFLILLLFSWLGIELSRHSEGVATIWFSNGLLFAVVIRKEEREWPWYFAIGLLADTLADVIYGDHLGLAMGVSVANSIEVILSTLLLTRWFGSPLQLSRLRPLVGFLLVAVAGSTAVCSALGTCWLVFFGATAPWWQVFRTWYLGDVLGMAIIAPLVYILQQPGFFAALQPHRLPKTLLFLALPAAATVLVFNHNQDPLMFAIFPAMLFVVFRLGFPGAVLSICMVAYISISLTINGHGPLMLIVGATLLHRIVVAQIFLAISVFTFFPVAALLEKQKDLERSLQKSEAEYRQLANTDSLTGQGNRRAFDEKLLAEWHRPSAKDQQLALLSIDIDLFKAYNDIYGHPVGDECLRQVSAIMASALKPYSSDRLYRLGGEEFGIILPDTSQKVAHGIAEKIRETVHTSCLEHSGSPLGCQTVSIGIAVASPCSKISALALLNLSDQALYQAKKLGRNRSEVAEGPLYAAESYLSADLAS